MSANANGRSSGCPGTGSGTHDQLCTVPSSETGTSSVTGSCDWKSYSGGGTATVPSESLPPSTWRCFRPDMNSESVGPRERV